MKRLVSAAMLMAGMVFVGSAHAEEHSLKAVMKHLGSEMHRISDGLLLADYEMVAHAAGTIAGHGHLSHAEEERIAGVLGKDMVQFRQADELVHHRALKLAEAAKNRNASFAVQRFGEIMDGCAACHAKFRERLRTP